MAPSITLDNVNEISSNLYLGGITAALEPQSLVDQGICAVVCCVRETEFPSCDFHKDLAYYRVDVEDIPREPIELFWPEATAFMHGFISGGKPVFVHCRAGVSRSASTVIAYLVSYQGYTLNDAFLAARSRRPVVTPNLGFMGKLCDFELEVRGGTEASVVLEKYESWYCGSQVGSLPEVGRSISTISTKSDSASDMSPSSRKAAGKLAGAVQKVIMANRLDSLSNTTHKNAIALDVPDGSSEPAAVQERMARVRALLLRSAAQDADLGYCQGMHYAAALFLATSESQGEAYWRFHAFVSGVRGLWLFGLPLLQTGLAQFAELARPTQWGEHLRSHLVQPSMYLPHVWLSFFTAWLPRSTLVECLELLEGNGIAGMLAMALAILDCASQRLLKQQTMQDILRALATLRASTPPPAMLMNAFRAWLPKAVAAAKQPSLQTGSETIGIRTGSRILVPSLLGGPAFDLPVMAAWVADEPIAPVAAPGRSRSPIGLSCWSWCSRSPRVAAAPAPAPRLPIGAGGKAPKRRASVLVKDQREEITSARSRKDLGLGSDREAREAAHLRRKSLAWSPHQH